jgi:hypothetical protein
MKDEGERRGPRGREGYRRGSERGRNKDRQMRVKTLEPGSREERRPERWRVMRDGWRRERERERDRKKIEREKGEDEKMR